MQETEPILRSCLLEDCNNRSVKRKYCNRHYLRLLRYGDPTFIKQPKEFHGGSDTLTYGVWSSMKARCHNPRDKAYRHYGGRGIKVCKRWRDSFGSFLEDMGYKAEGRTIERIDNDGNYEPSNCRWATRQAQAYNKRMRVTNKSGHPGVFYEKNRNLWQAYLDFNKKRIWLGYHPNKQDAVRARKSAELKYLSKLL